MVTRKPVPPPESSPSATTSSLPYPVTPFTSQLPQPNHKDESREHPAALDSESDSASAWQEEGLQKPDEVGVKQGDNPQAGLPASLRAGPPGYTPKGSQEMLRPNVSITNPYLKKQYDAQSESSAGAWGGFAERPPAHAPPPPPVPKDASPSQQFASLAVTEPSNNPWQPALNEKVLPKAPLSVPPISRQDSGNEAWSRTPEETSEDVVSASQHPVLVDMDEPESPAWDEGDDLATPDQDTPGEIAHETQQIDEGLHAWDETQGQNTGSTPAVPGSLRAEERRDQGEGWNNVGHGISSGPQESGIIAGNGDILEQHAFEEQAPTLPPRRLQEQPPLQPPRPTVDTTSPTPSSDQPSSAVRKQKKETYEIKKITWHDVKASHNPRVSPILVQNSNGPCPLLALVNAMTISTPANIDTALVETLRSREQVSLGLLLDAVLDELMSGRRGDAAQELPDVGELYSFLITLHTGMNVNPRFFPPSSNKRYSNDPRPAMSHIHPSEREDAVPGTFEDTKEMKLYSTFSIPLIHGWLPDRDSPAYAALKRSSNSYEDAQNLMFREEELEDKLQSDGLSFEEQATLEDVATIRAFFTTAATQLTPYGLETITSSMAPGAVAILFRNDHFSTLYRHPESLQLLQLVTDMGYAGHEEVVWESLTDVSGENAEFFSGDFRLVSASPQPPAESPGQLAAAGTSGPGQRFSSQLQTGNSSTSQERAQDTVQSPTTEQEDHDLALAMQLQEEEEERHRNEIARRRREAELSQQYIEQQGSPQEGNIPVSVRGGRGRGARARGSSGPTRGALDLRPAIPPRRSGPNAGGQPVDPEAGVDAPPPTYEQAATQPAYVPPADHPTHPSASPNGPAPSGRARMGSHSVSPQNMGNAGSGPGPLRLGRRSTGSSLIDQIPGRRPGPGLTQQQQAQREKDCVVM